MTPEQKLQSLVDHYARPENKNYGRLLIDKDGKLVTDKEGSPKVQVFTTGAMKSADDTENSITHLISTPRIDYVRDVMDPFGCDDGPLQKNKGVFYNHCWDGPRDLPIGRNLWLQKTREGVLVKTQYATGMTRDDFPGDCYRLCKAGFLNSYSIGFFAKGFEIMSLRDLIARVGGKFDIPNLGEFQLDEQVAYHSFWPTYEYSQVGVPMNQDATKKVMEKALSSELIHSDFGKTYFGGMAGGRPKLTLITSQKPTMDEGEEDPLRWNKSLSKLFDIKGEDIPPASLEYDLVSKFIGCPIKDIYENHISIPSAKMGSYLSGLRQELKSYTLIDQRNITSDGTEAPCVFEVIQLNSTKSDDFIVSGLQFYEQGEKKLVIRYSPAWFGLYLRLYTHAEKKSDQFDLIEKAWQLAATEFNFLKGEAFSLSGEFLPKTGETWDDVFLTPKNERALTSTLSQLNEKQIGFANRGAIFMGPPGTGKTISGRVIKNWAAATYIWISARDFYRSGAFGGLSYGFELAKELAPSVLFIEDVDNWLSDYSIDMIKTEMDGISRYSGVWTILTTNFPELLPKALIDRPGRFHDVLNFDLPDADVRKRMINKWIPEIETGDLAKLIQATAGYSGAHVYELAHFARTIQEQDGKTLSEAIVAALEKIKEQRDLIGTISRKAAGGLVLQAKLIQKFIGRPAGMEKLTAGVVTDVDHIKQLMHSLLNALGTKQMSDTEIQQQLTAINDKLDQALSLLSDLTDQEDQEELPEGGPQDDQPSPDEYSLQSGTAKIPGKAADAKTAPILEKVSLTDMVKRSVSGALRKQRGQLP